MLLIASSTHSIRGRTYSTLTLPEEYTFVRGVCASHYSFVRQAISCFLMVCVFVTYVWCFTFKSVCSISFFFHPKSGGKHM